MKKIFRWTIYLLIICTLILVAGSVFAADTKSVQVGGTNGQGGYTLLEPEIIGSAAAPTDFLSYINIFYQVLLYVAIALAIIYIVIGGFEYLTSAAASGKGEGKETIKKALQGLAIALLSYLILNTINPETVNWKFNICKLGTTGCPPAATTK